MRIIDLADRTPAQKQGPLSRLVVPRPIAMITTLDARGGVNVVPFGFQPGPRRLRRPAEQ